MSFPPPEITPAILKWLSAAAEKHVLPDRNLDPLQTSMRDFNDVSPHLEDLEKGVPPQHSDPTQRLTDLRKAKLANSAETKLSPLGHAVISKWREFAVADGLIENELARHIILVFEAARHNDPSYADMFNYWNELRESYSPAGLIDNWDQLYVLNYLDVERAGVTPGLLLRESKIALNTLDFTLEEYVKKVGPDDTKALKGAVKIDARIQSIISRGRHRATFCLAIEAMLLPPKGAISLIQKFGVPAKPREWKTLSPDALKKIEEILAHYAGLNALNVSVKTGDTPVPKKILSEMDDALSGDTKVEAISLPANIDFSKAQVSPPKNIAAPPKSEKKTGKVSKTDYEKKAAQSNLTGKAGEEFVFLFEKNKLSNKPELADKVTWVSQTNDELGYDIESFDESGNPLFIEVKSTIGNETTDFFISSYELQKAAELKDTYRIYRVFNLKKNPQFFEVKNPLGELLIFQPEAYRVKIKTTVS